MLPLEPEEAMQALDGALSMADEAIAKAETRFKDLRSEPVTLVDLAHLLTAIGEELAESQDVDPPTFSISVEGDRRTLVPVLQDEIYRIGREILRNAFRHSGARHVDARFYTMRNCFDCVSAMTAKALTRRCWRNGGRAGHWD